ncbi:hypothetical protein Esti_004023 [Eimeria stiedai]
MEGIRDHDWQQSTRETTGSPAEPTCGNVHLGFKRNSTMQLAAASWLVGQRVCRPLQKAALHAESFSTAARLHKRGQLVSTKIRASDHSAVSSNGRRQRGCGSASDLPAADVGAREEAQNSLLVTSNERAETLVPVGKLLAARGLCSRGEGDTFFSLGLVLLAGRRLERSEVYVHPDAPLQLAPRAERLLQQKLTLLLHKPMHFLTCPTDKQAAGCAGGKPVSRTLLCPENQWGPSDCRGLRDPRRLKKLVAAGRLDVESSGLQVYTQDGRVAAQLTGGTGEGVAKEYLVQVDVPPSKDAMTLLRSGLSLDGCDLRPAVVTTVPPAVAQRVLDGGSLLSLSEIPEDNSDSECSVFLSIQLREGRHRQIRRMCELVGLRALRIHRIRIGKILLGSLPPGRWRCLQPGETFS